jgi:hypothetical protein
VVKDHVIPAQCEGIVIARLENPLGVENGLVEPSPQAHPPEGIAHSQNLGPGLSRSAGESLKRDPSRPKAHERQPPRRISLAKQTEVSEMLNNMQRCGVIEESGSPWSSPVVIVRKRNGELRF